METRSLNPEGKPVRRYLSFSTGRHQNTQAQQEQTPLISSKKEKEENVGCCSCLKQR